MIPPGNYIAKITKVTAEGKVTFEIPVIGAKVVYQFRRLIKKQRLPRKRKRDIKRYCTNNCYNSWKWFIKESPANKRSKNSKKLRKFSRRFFNEKSSKEIIYYFNLHKIHFGI